MIKKITIKNDFHGTQVTLNARDMYLSAGQILRCRKKLCGISGCTCCQSETGARGIQEVFVYPEYSRKNGKLIGGEVIIPEDIKWK